MIFASDLHSPHIRVIDFKRIKMRPNFSFHSMDRYLELPVERQVLVHPSNKPYGDQIKFRSTVSVAGLAAGTLDYDGATSEETADRFVAVVLSNWKVVLLDSELQIVWQARIPHDEVLEALVDYGDLTPSEVTVRLLPYRVHMDDRGMVVVGLRIASAHSYSHNRDHQQHRQQQQMHKGNRANDASFSQEMMDQISHYNYYAFDGQTGELRWKHTSTDFLRDSSDTADERRSGRLHWQVDYKVETADPGMHRGETNWRNYASDMIRHLPHAFRHSHDTRLVVDYFTPLKRQNIKKEDHSNDDTTIGSSLRQSMSRFASRGLSNTAVKRRQRAKQGEYEWILGQQDGGASMLPPNVLVSHVRDGIEVIHMYTGMLVCQLGPLESDNLVYSDLNDDDIVESVSVIGCKASIRGDVSTPSSDVLFQANVCHSQTLAERFAAYFPQQQQQEISSNNGEQSVSTPAVFMRADGSQNVVLLASNGLVTAVAGSDYAYAAAKQAAFRIRFQSKTLSTFQPAPVDGTHHAASSFAEIVPYSLRSRQAYHDFILAIGDRVITVISPHTGKVEETFELPSPMTSPVTIVDFDDDGIQDIIVRTQQGLYGIHVRSHTGNNALTFCVIAMIMIVAALYWSSSDALTISNPQYVRKSERYQK